MDEHLLPNDHPDALPVPAFLIDANGTLVLVPEPLSFPQLSARPATLFDMVDDKQHQEVAKALATGHFAEPAALEVRLGGHCCHTADAILSLSARPDRPGYVWAQFTDVTAMREREREISRRESRWNSALVSSLSGVWDQNFSTGEMFGSDTWRAIRGMSEQDQIETSFEKWVELIHPDDRDHALHCIERQNAGDPAYGVFQYRERHKAGHWVWIECRGACIERDENGKPVRIVGTDTDVSDRMDEKSENDRIARSLKLALDASQVGVFEVDFDTGVTTWDAQMYEIFGVPRDTPVLVGGLWESLVHPDDLARVVSNVERNIANLQPFTDEYRILPPGGGLRHIRARSMLYTNDQGRRRMIGVNWDVTDDVALRNELERAKSLAETRNGELEAAYRRIEHDALHDYLTGLPNRRHLDEKLMEMSRSEGHPGIGILHIDLDRFKQINDTLGHHAGDGMLQHVAKLLQKNLKPGEFIARIGGDEFVLMVPFSGSLRKLALMADRLIGKLRKPVAQDGRETRLGASIGIACGMGRAIDYRQILLNADIALYNAKKRGRNRYEFFSSDKQDWLVYTKRLSDEILGALERDEFVPYYQFQFHALTLDITGVETLVRWQHPTEGLLAPDRFLAVAEELDAVPAIDASILEQALIDVASWRGSGVDIPKISVNVSARRLHDPGLLKSLDGLDFDPGKLAFELLESIFLDESDDVATANLDALRSRGIEIEIDDFGTGHASIIGLLKVSPDTLKIDREFIRMAPQSKEQQKLLRSIIDIGHSLGIKVVAEGVETVQHIKILQDLGCDSLQGFALCRPIPSRQVVDFVMGQSWRSLAGKFPQKEHDRACADKLPAGILKASRIKG